MARIVVTGATGTVGRAVAERAVADGHEVVAAVRNVEADLPDGARAVAFDFTRPETFAPALAGADGLFLLRPPAISDAARFVNPVVDAAEAAGVGHVAFLSVLGAERNPLLPHRATEKRLEASPLGYTLLRASNFMQNLAEQNAAEIRERDTVFVPAGDGRVSYVDARDVGEAAALVLGAGGPAQRALDLTGPTAIDHFEVAHVLSDVLGRRIDYARPGALAFAWRKLGEGEPLPFVLVMTGIYTVARLGLAARVTDDLAALLGRPATSFATFAADYRAAWA
ncbi:MAG: SDR family oxidoreductase [Rhodothermales bacterium]